MRHITVFIIIIVLCLSGCWGGNVKFESKNIEEEMKKSVVRLRIKNPYLIDAKHQSYFINSIRGYFLKRTDIIVDNENYQYLIDLEILNFNLVLVQEGGTTKVRLDFSASLNVVSTDNTVVLSNQHFLYTSVTNIHSEILNEPFSRSAIIDDITTKFFDNTALNFVYFVSTGWKGDYGYYTVKDGIIQSIFGGGGTNEESTSKRTNRRNIPTIGGE